MWVQRCCAFCKTTQYSKAGGEKEQPERPEEHQAGLTFGIHGSLYEDVRAISICLMLLMGQVEQDQEVTLEQ